MLRLTRDQVVAFRVAALHLDQRLPVDQLVEGVRPCGLQDTPPGNAMLGLAARVQGLTLEAWAAAVEREKSLVELWAMRGSPIVVATVDLPCFTAGLLADDEASLLHAITSGMDVVVAAAGISAANLLDRLSQRAAELLDGRDLSKRELGEGLVPALPGPLRDRLGDAGAALGMDPREVLTLTVARLISLKGVFVMAPREVGKEPTFVRTDQWLGRAPEPIAPIEAQAELVRRFLHAFAPATSEDLAWWANPQTSPAARQANEAHAARIWGLLDREVTEVERPDGSRGFVLTSDLSRLANPLTAVGVRLIPPYDPLLMARDRETLVAREHHRKLWRSTHNPGVVLSGGQVVATWTARKEGRLLAITLDSLGTPLDRHTRDAVGAEAALLAPLRRCSGAHLEVAD
jgi:hypothetical protein